MTESHSSVFTVSSCFYCAQAERRDWYKTAYSHVLQQVLGFKEPGVGALEMIATLTPPEREVFELVVRGMTNKQVAYALSIGPLVQLFLPLFTVPERDALRTAAPRAAEADATGPGATEPGAGRLTPACEPAAVG